MSLVGLLVDCCVSLRVRATFRVCSPSPSPSPQAKAPIKLQGEGEGEGEHTLNVAVTLKLTQQSTNKPTNDIHQVNTANRVKRAKGSLILSSCMT